MDTTNNPAAENPSVNNRKDKINMDTTNNPAAENPSAENPSPKQPPMPPQQPPMPPQQPPMPPQQPGYIYPAVPAKQRRVGTFTLGLTLTLIGVMIPLCLIFQDQAVRWFQFAPAVLILLGIEILYYAIRYKNGKLKYDGVSIFLVLVITIVSIITASIAPYFSNSAAYYRDIEDGRDIFELAVEETMAETGYSCDSIYYNDSGNHYFFRVLDYSGTEDLRIFASFSFSNVDSVSGEYPTKEELTDMYYDVVTTLAGKQLPTLRYLNIGINSFGYYSDIQLTQAQLNNVSRELIESLIVMQEQPDDFIDSTDPNVDPDVDVDPDFTVDPDVNVDPDVDVDVDPDSAAA